MRPEVTFIPPTASVEEAWRLASAQNAPVYLVGTADGLIGTVTRERLSDLIKSGQSAVAVAKVTEEAPPHVHPDHPLDVVLERFAQTAGVLPVVSRSAVHRVEGVITLDSIIRSKRSGSSVVPDLGPTHANPRSDDHI